MEEKKSGKLLVWVIAIAALVAAATTVVILLRAKKKKELTCYEDDFDEDFVIEDGEVAFDADEVAAEA